MSNLISKKLGIRLFTLKHFVGIELDPLSFFIVVYSDSIINFNY
jgi:hypothetical protein